MRLPAPALEHLCDVSVTIDAPIDVGPTPAGFRRLIPITGGTVSGAAMNGRVLPGGADFQLIAGDGTQAQLDARYVLELDGGSRVFVHNTAAIRAGIPVDPKRVYFRCQPRLEPTSPAWAWLATHQFIGTGVRQPDAVHLSFYKVC
jgi:hypothetical protein